MSLVATPFTPLSLYMNDWTLPEAVCKLLPTTMGVSVYVSTLTSMAIALDRFFVIVHPFLPRMKHKDPINNVSSCRENWPKESSREVFTIVSFVLQFVIPCSIISVLHTQIGSGTKTHIKEERDIKRKRRTNTMLIAMVVIFVICWIPLNILWMVMDVHTMSSAVYNPFLYAWMNSNFRKEFHRNLPCFFLKSKFYTNQITTQTIGGESTAIQFKETSQILSNKLNLNHKSQQINKINLDNELNSSKNNDNTFISHIDETNKQYDDKQMIHRTEVTICHNPSNDNLNKININLNDQIEMKKLDDNDSNDDQLIENTNCSQTLNLE
ncbi:unnamed protein product [Schistosoma curassoni]|nr:unnamed protein product [Schistosoma curassoni]